MAFELPKLPYGLDALAPVIDKQTMEFHYGKHHQAYVNNLNNLIPGTQFEGASLEEIIKGADGGIYNNAAQVFNHTFYFHSFKPNGGGEPTGALAEAIASTFGSYKDFKEQFSKAAATLF
ncbi:MAG TPA: superoxide dismutase [Fe], partial [Bacteroidales bacterium]|nr:superoxide dismutase [Fe] [Bacteroidales bacterium]